MQHSDLAQLNRYTWKQNKTKQNYKDAQCPKILIITIYYESTSTIIFFNEKPFKLDFE